MKAKADVANGGVRPCACFAATKAAADMLTRGFTSSRDLGGPVFELKRGIDLGDTVRKRAREQLALGASQIKLIRGYSQERLISFLTRLGMDVEIVVRPRARKRQAVGSVSVIFA